MAKILTADAAKLECIHTAQFAWVRQYLVCKTPAYNEQRESPIKLKMLANIDEVETAVWECENVSYQFRYHRDTGACWFSMQIHAHYAAPAESLFEFFIPPKERDFLTILSILDTI